MSWIHRNTGAVLTTKGFIILFSHLCNLGSPAYLAQSDLSPPLQQLHILNKNTLPQPADKAMKKQHNAKVGH